jgi:hypothetical protein
MVDVSDVEQWPLEVPAEAVGNGPTLATVRAQSGRVMGPERANSLMRYVCGARGSWDHLVLCLAPAFF